VALGVWFAHAAFSAWTLETSAALSCSTPFDPTQPLAYIQYNVREQSNEPYFNGGIFMSLGDVPTGPSNVDVLTTGGGKYGNTIAHAELFRDVPGQVFWMKKEADNIPLIRTSGSHKDFPFDSAVIDFDTTFKPTLPLRVVIVRNFNASFYIPCDQFKAQILGPDKLHVHFELRRNPLVQLMAVVMLIAAKSLRLDNPVCSQARRSANFHRFVLSLLMVNSGNPQFGDESISNAL
jgi:hypothetical protein